MDIFQAVMLALVQGLSEFLPISGSAHLMLVSEPVDWRDPGLAFDVAVQLGTLSAVVLYCRHQLSGMASAWFGSLGSRYPDLEARLAWVVLLASIPLGLSGLLLHEVVDTSLRSPLVIAVATILFGLLLWYADARGPQTRCEYRLSAGGVALIAFAQALALIPGASRSGIAISAGLLAGLDRKAAARLSFLLSIPAVLMAASCQGSKLLGGEHPEPWTPILLGFSVSAISAYAGIHYFLKLLDRIGMLPFVCYRLVLGGVLLWRSW